MRYLVAMALLLISSSGEAETRNYTKSATAAINPAQLAASLNSALGVTGTGVIVGITPTLVIVSHPLLTSANDAAVNAAIAAYVYDPLYAERGQGVAYVSRGTDQVNLNLRAAAGLLVDELNALRGWTLQLKAAVAAATSLADLKVRVSALPDLPDRTLSQAVTAIQNKIQSGAVD